MSPLSRSQSIPSPGPDSVVIPIGWALQAVAETPYPLRSLAGDYMRVCYEQSIPCAPVEGCDSTWALCIACAFQIESWSAHAYSLGVSWPLTAVAASCLLVRLPLPI